MPVNREEANGLPLHAGLRQRLRDRDLAGFAAAGHELAAAAGLRALCRAAFRLALHGAARHQRALLALSHPAERQAPPALQGGRLPAVEDCAECRRPPTAAGAIALGPAFHAERADRFPRRHPHHDDGRRCARPVGHGRACLCRQCRHGRRPFLQRRRRDAGGGAGRRRALRHRDGHHRAATRRNRRHPARPGVQGRADRRSRARLHLRELRRQVHHAQPRPDRRQLPGQPARLQDARRLVRGKGDALPPAS